MKYAAVALLLIGLALQAEAAGPIYRCGNEYTQQPCPGGKMLDVSDPRSAAQRVEARKIAAAERRAAADLERERRAGVSADKASAAKASASGAERGKAQKKQGKATRIVPLKAAG